MQGIRFRLPSEVCDVTFFKVRCYRLFFLNKVKLYQIITVSDNFEDSFKQMIIRSGRS